MTDSMPNEPVNLALETSSRHGSIAVGRGDRLLETVVLAEQQRHAIELLPRLNALAAKHRFAPADIREVFVSVGPGSFTGLRVAVTTAKMLALAHGAKLVAVPTLDVVVQNAAAGDAGDQAPTTVAVLLNAKGGRCFTAVYDRRQGRWMARGAPALLTPSEAIARAGTPLTIIADRLPTCDLPDGVTVRTGPLAVPRAESVWRLGRNLARREAFTAPHALSPLYVRLPDAEEKWRERHAHVERREHNGAPA